MYAYCWYEQHYGAIKMGVAHMPAERMVVYAVEFDLSPDGGSLVQVPIADGEAVQTYIHLKTAITTGLGLSLIDGFTELYAVGPHYDYLDFEEAFELMVDLATKVVRAKDKERALARLLRFMQQWHEANYKGGTDEQ